MGIIHYNFRTIIGKNMHHIKALLKVDAAKGEERLPVWPHTNIEEKEKSCVKPFIESECLIKMLPNT